MLVVVVLILLCVAVYNDDEAKVSQAPAAPVDQRAAAGLHVQGLGSTVEECPGEALGRSVNWGFSLLC